LFVLFGWRGEKEAKVGGEARRGKAGGAMAGGAVVAAGEFKHYPGRTTFFVCMVCVVAASGGLMFGYDVGISGNYRAS